MDIHSKEFRPKPFKFQGAGLSWGRQKPTATIPYQGRGIDQSWRQPATGYRGGPDQFSRRQEPPGLALDAARRTFGNPEEEKVRHHELPKGGRAKPTAWDHNPYEVRPSYFNPKKEQAGSQRNGPPKVCYMKALELLREINSKIDCGTIPGNMVSVIASAIQFEIKNPVMLRDILLITSKVIRNDRAQVQVRSLLKLFQEKDFLGLKTLIAYRSLLSTRAGSMEAQSPQVIADLETWLSIYEKMMVVSSNSFEFVAAKEVSFLLKSQEQQVIQVSYFSFNDSERELAKQFARAVQLADRVVAQQKAMMNQAKATWDDYYPKQSLEERIEADENPPDDFRQLPVVPTIGELLGEVEPFLRPIKTEGEFNDLDHYLDCLFRLLKEDFIVDLRHGIETFKQSKSKDQNLSVNIFRYAEVAGLAATQDFFGFYFKIYSQNIKWMNSKKLKFGTLFVFSTDNFEKKIYQGIVRMADFKEMEQTQSQLGYAQFFAQVVLANGTDICEVYKDMIGKNVVLIESIAYFEAYYHILVELQKIKTLPFENLLVKSDPKLLKPPSYLNGQSFHVTHCIREGYQAAQFDESQGEAFLSSFAKEINLIQGPPGTGKTYIGERVVMTLLALKKLTGYPAGPIMVTCYTNHALDQFLSKICKYTDLLVRLGGRSRDESFLKFSLWEASKKLNIKLGGDFYNQRSTHSNLLSRFKQRTESFNRVLRVRLFMPQLVEAAQLDAHAESALRRLLIDIEDDYNKRLDDYLANLTKKKAQSFRNFYDKTMKKVLVFPPMFFWLGILSFEQMLQEMKNEEERKQANQEEEAEQEYLEDRNDEYIEKYNEIANSSEQQRYMEKLLSMLLPRKSGLKTNSVTYDHLFLEWFQTLPNINLAQMKDQVVQILFSYSGKDFFPQDKRKLLNNFLIELCKRTLEEEIEELVPKIKESYEELSEYENETNQQILNRCEVIAMTTTGAAKYKSLLNKIKSDVIVVEEAAQILEAHLITSMNSDTKHMILIGDHQQLRPVVNNMEMQQKYNLDISMFERLINNGFSREMLLVQRRMRPEISEVVRKIYPDVVDHPSVTGRPNVRGMGTTNYFFFNHNFPEEVMSSVQSKTNQQEAEMVVAFADYLLKQEYSPQQITILSLYTGQILKLRRILRDYYGKLHLIHQIKITSVDNFQGEENDIIILSLVRSNHQNQIGFLKASNRVCVALSRARQGFYIFGNANCLRIASLNIKKAKLSLEDQEANRQQHIWVEALEILVQRKSLDSKMILKCENHSNETVITGPWDFDEVPEGGCNEICKARLECGHSCELYCHYQNKNRDPSGHSNVVCNKKCERQRDCGHDCSYLCTECKEGHQPCKEQMLEQLDCGHMFWFSCQAKDEPKKCQIICSKDLPCGHQCKRACFAECNKVYDSDAKKGYISSCKEGVKKMLSCGHTAEVDCGLPAEEFVKRNQCQAACNGILECGHPCPNTCSQCWGKRFHGQCTQKCGKINVCNHECSDLCSRECNPCDKPCMIKCSHSMCTQKCGQECILCVEPCNFRCKHSSCSKKCFEECDREPCEHPCEKVLNCGHPCIGYCGESCPPSCRVATCKNYNPETFEIHFGNEDAQDARFVLLEDCKHAIVGQDLLKYVEFKQSESSAVKYIECPKCTTLIQNCPRIQHAIKRTTRKVGVIKRKIQEDLAEIRDQQLDARVLKELNGYISLLRPLTHIIIGLSQILKIAVRIVKDTTALIESPQKELIAPAQQLMTQGTFINFMSCLMKEIYNYRQILCTGYGSHQIRNLIVLMDPFLEQLQNKQVPAQRLHALENMLKAFTLCLKAIKANIRYYQMPKEIQSLYSKIREEKLFVGEEMLKCMEELLQKYRLGGNLAFNQMIIKAIGLGSGHWYVCSNGHPYVIDQCGGAMEESRCPECKERIGGRSHQLVSGNHVATEFSGATRPAYDPEDYQNNYQAALRLQRQLDNEGL